METNIKWFVKANEANLSPAPQNFEAKINAGINDFCKRNGRGGYATCCPGRGNTFKGLK